MFSYTGRVFPLATPAGTSDWKLVATAELVIDDKLVIKGFKILSNGQDTFASAPSEKSNKKDEKTGKDIYWPTVAFVDPKDSDEDKMTPLQKEILDYIVAEYKKSAGGAAKTAATSPKTQAAATGKSRGPLWGNS